MSVDLDSLERLIATEEGQYFERKSLFEGPPGKKRPRDRKTVRAEIAYHVAAFANADGGTLVLGVEDDGTVTGHVYPEAAVEEMLRAAERQLRPPLARGARVALRGHELLVFDVAPAASAVMVVGDGFPRREGDEVLAVSEALIDGLKQSGLIASPEARPVASVQLRDLDPAPLRRAMEASAFRGTAEEYLVSRRLADVRGTALVLRTAAVWLFAKEPAAIEHPNLGVRIFRVQGTEQRVGPARNVQDFPRIEGNLVHCLETAHQRVGALVRSSSKLHDLFFKETPEYPTFAWQEAVVNALAHRDYSIESRSVEVWLYDDRMEVKSPGGLLPEVSLDALLERRRVHASRNPRLARVLAELGLMREQGEGIPRMIEAMELSWLPAPELTDEPERTFVVVLRNEPLFAGRGEAWTGTVRGLPLDVRQKRALIAFSDRESFQSGDYQRLNRVDRDEAYRELSELVEGGYLTSEGLKRGTKYRVEVEVPSWAGGPVGLALLRRIAAERGWITNADFQRAFSVDRHEARRGLAKLVERAALVREGGGRGARYVPGPTWAAQLAAEERALMRDSSR